MNQAITMEVRFFLTSVVWGVFLLVMYDMLRILRTVVKHGAVWIGIEDLIYWVIGGILIFRMMYRMNDGVIRGFSMLGIFLGMILYKYSISDFLVEKISLILKTIIKWIRKLIHILITPARLLLKKVKELIQKMILSIKKLGKKAYTTLKSLQNKWKWNRIKNNSQDENNGSSADLSNKKKKKRKVKNA